MSSSLNLPKAPGWVAEFKKFIARGNVIDLAVAVIIGAAFTSIVGSLVKDIINPVVGRIIGGVDFTNIFFSLDGRSFPTLAEAQKAGAPTVNVGLFVNAVIQFLIVAFVIFWMVKVIDRVTARERAAPGPTATETLLTEIRDILKERRAD